MKAFAPAVTKLSSTFYLYQADLTGLQPGTTYAYRVMMNGQSVTANPVNFTTAGPGNFSFLVYGDSGENTPEQRTMIDLMTREQNVAFAIHTGDLAYPEGSYAGYDTGHFGLNAPLIDHLPFFPTPGNHDYMVDSGAPYVASHVVPDSNIHPDDRGRYYSFDWGDVHFTSIDSNLIGSAANDRMLAWLENDLRSTRQYWKVVFLHHPPYPTGHHCGDVICAKVRWTVNPIFDKYGVQLVLAGHEHGYERTVAVTDEMPAPAGFGTTYVITGGGGANLHDVGTIEQTAISLQTYNYVRIDVNGSTLTLRAIDLNGKEIDRVTLQPQPVLADRPVLSVGDYSESVAPGSLVSIFGYNLALRPLAHTATPVPAELGGVRVRLGNTDLPLSYVSPNQINVQIPFDAKGPGTLTVTAPNGVAQRRVNIAPTAPSIIAVTNANTLATALNAPKAGGVVVVYATGLGACAQTFSAGTAALASPTLTKVDVWLGDIRIQPAFAGLTQGFSGLYQVNFSVPAGTAAGTYPLRIATSDGTSRSVPFVTN